MESPGLPPASTTRTMTPESHLMLVQATTASPTSKCLEVSPHKQHLHPPDTKSDLKMRRFSFGGWSGTLNTCNHRGKSASQGCCSKLGAHLQVGIGQK